MKMPFYAVLCIDGIPKEVIPLPPMEDAVLTAAMMFMDKVPETKVPGSEIIAAMSESFCYGESTPVGDIWMYLVKPEVTYGAEI